MAMLTPVPPIFEGEMTPLVETLLTRVEEDAGVILELQEKVQILSDEIARLKKQKPRPKIPPSRVSEDGSNSSNKDKPNGKRPGSDKRHKTASLVPDETRDIPLENVPAGAKFNGWHRYTVQDISISKKVIEFRLACWVDAQGKIIQAQLPPEYSQGHFGPDLKAYCLFQYYHCHVTQPLLLESLRAFGVDISSGQLNNILIEDNESFHREKEELLEPGLEASSYINVDDTLARHDGKNGYCTHIGSALFAYFESTASKSRENFLKVLRGKHTDYVICEETLWYMFEHKATDDLLNVLENAPRKYFASFEKWIRHLNRLGIVSKEEQRLATEGALVGSLFCHGFHEDLVIVSDDAPQFVISIHALCWIHAERHFRKFIPINDRVRQELEEVRDAIWNLYKRLKAYKLNPEISQKESLSAEFDQLFSIRTSSPALNALIDRTRANKSQLLRVLDYPNIPLHNNDSERDIREYVKRRKVSGSTRSESGRKARDTFTSLKKTCRKLGISFWEYLRDRIRGDNRIVSLGDIIRERGIQAAAP